MKKILETKKDYEKSQQAPRPGEKVRSDSVHIGILAVGLIHLFFKLEGSFICHHYQ